MKALALLTLLACLATAPVAGQGSVVFQTAHVPAVDRVSPGTAVRIFPAQAAKGPGNHGMTGAVVGGVVGLLLGIWYDIEARQFDGDQTVGQIVLAPLVIMAVTVPVGALLGGAISRKGG